MTSRLGLIALTGLAGLALTVPAGAQTTRNTGGYIFTDIVITSMRGGRTVATTRTDGQGRFRFDLPAGDYNICLNGPGLRSAIDRSGGSAESDSIIGVLIGLLLPAVQAAPTEQQRTFPSVGAGLGQNPRRGPPPAARDLCFPYVVDVAIRQTGPGPGDLDSDGRPDRDFNGQDPAEPGSTGDSARLQREGRPIGTNNGTGDADRRVDPRIPPPGARGVPARPDAPTVTVTGTVRLVR